MTRRVSAPKDLITMDELVIDKITQLCGLEDSSSLVRINKLFAKVVQQFIYRNVVVDFKDWKKGYQKVQINENQPVILPESLQTVIFSREFNQPILFSKNL